MGRFPEGAHLICVLPVLHGEALVAECSEHVIGPIVSVQFFLDLVELVLDCSVFALGLGEVGACLLGL